MNSLQLRKLIREEVRKVVKESVFFDPNKPDHAAASEELKKFLSTNAKLSRIGDKAAAMLMHQMASTIDNKGFSAL